MTASFGVSFLLYQACSLPTYNGYLLHLLHPRKSTAAPLFIIRTQRVNLSRYSTLLDAPVTKFGAFFIYLPDFADKRGAGPITVKILSNIPVRRMLCPDCFSSDGSDEMMIQTL